MTNEQGLSVLRQLWSLGFGHWSFPMLRSVKVARRPVKPFGVGASPTAADFWGS